MSTHALQSWLERELALDGVMAAGGGGDLSSGASAIATGELVLAADEAVWRAIGGALREMQRTGAEVEEMVWSFEQAMLCTVLRADGAWMGVFTGPKLSDDTALALRDRLDAFKRQKFK